MKKTSIAKRIVALLLLAVMLLSLTSCAISKYKKAAQLIAQGRYEEAAQIYTELGTYEDSAKLAQYAKAADAGEKGNFEACLTIFGNLGDYQDSPQRLQYYTARQYEAQAAANGAANAYEAYENYIKAAEIYHFLPLYLDADARDAACIQAAYDMPAMLAAEGDYGTAAEIMGDFADYMKDKRAGSGVYTDALNWKEYYNACAIEAEGEYVKAARIFDDLDGFGDAAQRSMAAYQTVYTAAEAALAAGDPYTAYVLFGSMPEYFISADRAEESAYLYGEKLLAEGNYADAKVAFENAGDYSDASTRYAAYWYAQGEAYLAVETPDYEAAKAAFTEAGDYSDASTRYAAYWYAQGEDYLAAETPDYESAKAAFIEAGDYSDAAELAAYGCDYQKAQDLMAAGDYSSAYNIYLTLKGYKDVDTLLSTDENLKAVAARDAKFAVGNYVTFGSYPQTAAGTDDTPIEWLVLARDGNNAFLISRYGLDYQPYHKSYTDITWEKCTLRTWLNDTFINKAFSAQEQVGILTTHVPAHKNPKYPMNPGNDTQDKIFLLSITEAETYFQNDEARECKPTAYAVQQGAHESTSSSTKGNCRWWLRSPGYDWRYAAFVLSDGSLYHSGCIVANDFAVRPALWIDLDSGIF